MPLDTQTRAWLAALHRGGAYSYWWTLENRQSAWWETGKYLALPGGRRNVYVGVHPVGAIPTHNTRGEAKPAESLRSHNDTVVCINCLFAEFDAKDARYGSKEAIATHLETLEPTPSVIIDSGGGYHTYWFLSEPWHLVTPEDRKAAQDTQRAWVLLVGGDDVKDLARVLRVPGTFNHKYDPPRPVQFVSCDLARRYERAELAQMCAGFLPTPGMASTERTTGDVADVGSRWLGSAVARVRSAPDGTKHHALLKAARALGGLVAHGALSEAEIERSLFAAIELKAEDTANARKTIQDGIAYGIAAPWPADKLERGYQEQSDTAYSANSANSAKQLEAWGAAIPFGYAELPTFPTEIFPDWLRAFVEAEAEATQTPVDLAAMLALSVLATCCQRWVMVQGSPGWYEPVNLYGVTGLPPGSRKSAVFRAFLAALLAYEQQQSTEAKIAIAAAATHKDILEEQLSAAKRNAAKARTAIEQQDALDRADELSEELANHITPVVPRLVVDDVTPETLATILSEQGGRLAALSPEGDVFAMMAGRYTQGTPNFSVFLKAHAGDTLRVDRRGRSEFVDWPALTIGITTQPDVIRGLAEKAGFRGQGLLGRFLYALPESLVGRRKTNPDPVPEAVRQAYHAGIAELLAQRAIHSANCANTANTTHESLNTNFIELVISLTISAEARPLFTSFLEWLEPHLAPDGAFGSFADWAGKLAGAILRIAGLLHMATRVGSHNSHNSHNEIDAPTLAAALQLSTYLIAHAKQAFSEMGADPAIAGARRALRWITDKNASIFTKRDLFEAMKGTVPKADDLDPILKLLTDHSYIRPVEADERPGPGRKPSQRYEVNPHIGSHNSHNSPNVPEFVMPVVKRSAPELVYANGHHADMNGHTSDANGLIDRLKARKHQEGEAA